jgi:glycosyltransferase involved in cell wall biosynthesis
MSGMNVVMVSTYPPRRCGIAQFAADLRAALAGAVPQWTVTVCAVDRDGLSYGPEVVEVIRQDCPDDYHRAALNLAARGTDLVVIQHEYGIFGGPDGSDILDLARALTTHGVPYVVTLHTVLAEPSSRQATTLAELCDGAAYVTGFTPTAQRLAALTGVADPDRFVVVPHGAPAVLRARPDMLPPIRPAVRDALRALGGRRMLATFGLIGPSKGLETAVAALPAVVARHPDVRYIIAGATHPEVARQGREAYRSGLAGLARRLGVHDHVHFIDNFLTEPELAALLARTDLYLTPYRSPEQICSGALTFAIAAGCPVVSTAYHYAVDTVTAPDRPPCGVLVPFDDPAAFAEAISSLLDDPVALAAARQSARDLGGRLLWPAVAARFAVEVADAVPRGTPRRLPGLRTGHLDTIVDEIGIIQFARGATPDPDSGYCVDDAARLAIVAAGLARAGADGVHPARWLAVALRLLNAALDAEGMHNMLGYDGVWLDRPHLGDHVGRACWALGVVASGDVPPELKARARLLLDGVVPLVPALTAMRSRAYAVLGLARLDEPDRELTAALRGAVAGLAGAAHGAAPWFEPMLTYDNARLPQALLAGGDRLAKPSIVDLGLSTLDWYSSQVGLHGTDPVLRLVGNRWRRHGDPPVGDEGDEQPLDATATVEALLEALRVTGDQRYARLAGRAFMWFHGLNRAGVALYDPGTAGCRDGLSVVSASVNQGAESTLAYFQALLAMAESGLVELAPHASRVLSVPRPRDSRAAPAAAGRQHR